MIVWLAAARAAEPPVDPEDTARADLRTIETFPGSFVLDQDGTRLEAGPVFDTRLRLQGTLHQGPLRAEGQLDLFSGQLAGRPWNLGPEDERRRDTRDALSLAGVVPRVATLGVRAPWFDAEAGLALSDWGLGLVANGGEREPLFGRTDFGDRVLRLRIATTPARDVPLYLIVAGDRVVADDLARWSEDDVAWQALCAGLYARDEHAAGLYVVGRTQRDADDLGTRAVVADAYLAGRRSLGPWTVRAAAEGALIRGRTDVAASYAAAADVPVRSEGLVVVGSATRDRWTAHARLALASGDRTPDDGRVTDFRFDRDYDVGFVLFDELVADLDLAAFHQATDPSVVATPSPGAETLVAEGAFHQAAAAQPAIELRAGRWVTVRAGAVFAWSTAPIAQPYATFRNGGVPTNHLGVPTGGRYLGTELDAAAWIADTSPSDEPRARPSAGLQVGAAFPSTDLAPEVSRLDHVLVVGQLAF
ncbi:MAG: hypothetical protein ABMA64_04260 [Myxococcota bacterium]